MPNNGTGNPWKCEMKAEGGRGNKRSSQARMQL